TGSSLNIISLSALTITIGLVVDDAIVVLENITTHIERGSRPRQAAVYGTEEVSLSIIASTLTIVAVFLPMTMVGGFAGIMFKQLGWMVSIIITLSLIISMTLTPMMSSRMLRSEKDRVAGAFDKWYNKHILPMLDGLDSWYARVVNRVVRHRGLVMTVMVVVLIAGMIVSFVTLKTEFMPASDNNEITMTLEMPTGTRMEIARETGARISDMLRQNYPEIEIVSFSVGQADEDNVWAVLSENASNIMSYNIRLVKANERDKSIFQIADEIRGQLSLFPELYRYKVTSGGDETSMTGESTLDVEIYGYDLAVTDRIAAELKDKLTDIEGLRNVNISRKDYRMEYQIRFDREKLSLNGLTMSTAATAVRNRINGLTMTQFREDGDEYDIRVRYDERYRQSLEDIQNILIYTPTGAAV
ncbi:MAG TPA: multidrug transporter AcrB, partial [Porphyromonadaceae bacterium]|nr:multidrug transporter AcrB [Porphyromonadaceae bacterium]